MQWSRLPAGQLLSTALVRRSTVAMLVLPTRRQQQQPRRPRLWRRHQWAPSEGSLPPPPPHRHPIATPPPPRRAPCTPMQAQQPGRVQPSGPVALAPLNASSATRSVGTSLSAAAQTEYHQRSVWVTSSCASPITLPGKVCLLRQQQSPSKKMRAEYIVLH